MNKEKINKLTEIINKYCFQLHELKGWEVWRLSRERETLRKLKIDSFRMSLAKDLNEFKRNEIKNVDEYYFYLKNKGIITCLGDKVILSTKRDMVRWKVI